MTETTAPSIAEANFVLQAKCFLHVKLQDNSNEIYLVPLLYLQDPGGKTPNKSMLDRSTWTHTEFL